jgi:hypothetical protein
MHCQPRMDSIALSIALGFFAASWGVIALCERSAQLASQRTRSVRTIWPKAPRAPYQS